MEVSGYAAGHETYEYRLQIADARVGLIRELISVAFIRNFRRAVADTRPRMPRAAVGGRYRPAHRILLARNFSRTDDTF